jgi:hypothetical protein
MDKERQRVWSGHIQWQIESGWLGKAPSKVREYLSADKYVHRVKVDEQRGFFITTHRTGGLLVTDLERDVTIWSLSKVRLQLAGFPSSLRQAIC